MMLVPSEEAGDSTRCAGCGTSDRLPKIRCEGIGFLMHAKCIVDYMAWDLLSEHSPDEALQVSYELDGLIRGNEDELISWIRGQVDQAEREGAVLDESIRSVLENPAYYPEIPGLEALVARI